MRIALASCTDLPDWEVDDQPLHAALCRLGVRLEHPAWDDAAVRWSDFDGVLIRTTWDYVPRHEAFLAWVQAVGRASRIWNDPAVVQWNLDKRYLRALEREGVPTVPTLWLEAGVAPTLDALTARGWRRAFLKPAVGASAIGTLRFEVDAPGVTAARALTTSAACAHLVQPYLSRVERDGERSAIVVEGVVTHLVRKVPVAGDYRVQDDYGAHDEPYEPGPAERDLVSAAMHAVGALDLDPLVYRVDWLLDDDGAPLLNELEAIEPSLFFRHGAGAAERLARALVARVRSRP